ncbi:MAG: LysR family transcriptional regulator [Desulfarculus sp.]|nr:LysR family transcriptional regulator [Desulfarculus sp.]
MELRSLKTFRMVAALLSFQRAARALNYAQSTVSAQVRALEEELGVPLFERLGRAILLTEAGERLLPYAEKLLALAEESKAEVASGLPAQGMLTIRVPETLAIHRLPAVLAWFRRRWPGVGLSLVTCAHDSLAGDLAKGLTDLAFLLAESIVAPDLKVEALAYEQLTLVAPPGHPLAALASCPLAALEGQDLLLTRTDCSYRKLLRQALAQEGVRPGAILELNSTEAIKRCVAAGLGLSVLPRVAVEDELRRGRLAALNLEQGDMEVAVLMVWHKDKWLSPGLRAFMEAARQGLGPGLPAPPPGA